MPLADNPVASFSDRLVEAIMDAGHRVLSINANASGSGAQDSAATPIEQVLKDEQYLEGWLGERSQERYTALCRGGGDSACSPLLSVERLVAVARKSYDAVLVETAPVLTSSDALRLASIVDIHLHVVSWRKTRRRPTLLAIQRFRKIAARISGIALIDADLHRYRKYPAVDQFYYSGTISARKPKEDARSTSRIKVSAAVK